MPSTKAYLRPRPYRVAFLVEESERSPAILEAVFQDGCRRWGGRFSLIVPCDSGEIRAAYLPWLRAYDPDIIYSYVQLAEPYVERLHELFCPAFLIKHHLYHPSHGDPRAFQPKLPVQPLTVMSVAGVLARGDMLAPPQPIAIIDTHIGVAPSSFLQENFGCYNQVLGSWPIARNMAEFFSPTIFVPSHIQDNPRAMPRAIGDIVSSEAELITRIATQRNLRGFAQLSACLSPRLELPDTMWANSVNIVVGDTFEDRLLFWNARHRLPVYLDGGIVTLKLSRSDLEDADRFQAVGEIISNRIYVPVGGNASHSHVIVRSVSLDQADLDRVASRLKALNSFNHYSGERLPSADAVVPDALALQHARQHVEPGNPFEPVDWHECIVTDEVLRPPNVRPRHLRDMPQLPDTAKQGVWAVDLDIERSVNHSGIQNIHHRWRLPRRLRMTPAFLRAYQLGRMSPICMPRVIESGLLSLAASNDANLPDIALPTDEVAFRHALYGLRDWWPFEPKAEAPQPGKAFDGRPSDKGRYLTALLRMGGSVRRAEEIFLSEFWRQQFEKLGATPKVTEKRLATVKATLRKRLRDGQLQTDEEWSRLAQTVLQEARAERSPSRYLRFDHLATEFETFRNAFWSEHDSVAPRSEWDGDEQRSLETSVKYLCERQILNQGHEWRCRQCFNNNWVSIDALKRAMTCEVCGNAASAPVAEPWHFRLNGFVSEGLREHGLLPVLWCLAHYANRSSASFYFLESQELFFSAERADAGKNDAELDLLIVGDGVVRLCEAKASGHDIDIPKLAELAKRLRPDLVTLAVMERRTRSLEGRGKQLASLLVGEEIGAELLTLDDVQFDDGPQLPTGTGYRMRLF